MTGQPEDIFRRSSLIVTGLLASLREAILNVDISEIYGLNGLIVFLSDSLVYGDSQRGDVASDTVSTVLSFFFPNPLCMAILNTKLDCNVVYLAVF